MPIVQTESEHNPPVNGSYFSYINPADGGYLLEKYNKKYHDFGCALMANLFASEGQPGKVILSIKNIVFFKCSQVAKNLNFFTLNGVFLRKSELPKSKLFT